METSESKIKKLLELVSSASAQLVLAKEVINELGWADIAKKKSWNLVKAAAAISNEVWGWDDDQKTIEWVFDWEKMIDSDWFSHPIPANYISKSKLVEGDWLKLSVSDDWRFLYKQIKPAPRKHLSWILSLEDGQYTIIANWKTYKVILAAVTYFKAWVWDRLAIIVPDNESAEWAAIDWVMPN